MSAWQPVTFTTNDVVVYLAAAGCAKTTALMDEMSRELETYRPDEIAFVTFTRKGVAQGIERALMVNPQLTSDSLIYFRTLHALCFKVLGLNRGQILEAKHLDQFNALTGYSLTGHKVYEQQSVDDRLLSRYDAIRNGVTEGALVEEPVDGLRYRALTGAYEQYKKQHDKVDFHDCLLRVKERGEPIAGVRVAFIDEAQDLTRLQWEVCRIAFGNADKIRIAGDDYQAIFSYSGADPRILIDLADTYQTVKLEKSYRLPCKVYQFSRALVGTLIEKEDKDFVPAKDMEGFVDDAVTRDLLVEHIAQDIAGNGYMPSRWYLLFRNNRFITEFTDLLNAHQILYHTAQGFCLAERDLLKIKRYYEYQKEGADRGEGFQRFCEKYHVTDIHADYTGSSLIPVAKQRVFADYIQKYGLDPLIDMARREAMVLVSTTHRVKGGEADFVAVFTDSTPGVDRNGLLNPDEELRVMYVACTRARMGLYLVPNKYGGGVAKIASMVKELM
jgi:superfamily I DNA/RNA helicase